MINCAHPTHFAARARGGGDWVERLGGIRANASKMSHAELDEAEELDEGDPASSPTDYRALRPKLPNAATSSAAAAAPIIATSPPIADAWLERG